MLKTLKNRRRHTLPVVSTPYIQALHKTQRQYFWGIVLVGVAFGFYSYVFVQKRAQAQTPISTVITTKALRLGHILTAADLEVIVRPRHQVPPNAFASREVLIGKTLIQSVDQREVLVGIDVSPRPNPESITAQFKQGRAFSVSEDWLVAPLPALAPGDLVDVLVTNPKSEEGSSVTLATGVAVIAVETSRSRKNLVLQVTQPQAEALLSGRGLRLPMQILVHSSIPSNPSLPDDSNR